MEPIAWRPVLIAAAALGVVLSVWSNGYGFARDELYFKTLPPARGYVDQPWLTPFLSPTVNSRKSGGNWSSGTWPTADS